MGSSLFRAKATTFVRQDLLSPEKTVQTKALLKAKLVQEEWLHKLQLLRLKYPDYDLQVSTPLPTALGKIEEEFRALLKLSADQRLSEEEKSLVETYKLHLMEATQLSLLKTAPSTLEAAKSAPKSSVFRYFVFAAFLLLEFVPMIWGSYLGITGLMSTVPWLPGPLISGIGLLVCGIEAILYYAVKGPLLRRALGIPTSPYVEPCLDIYDKQLQALKSMDQLLLRPNKMDSVQYESYTRLATLFSEQLRELKTYAIYIKASFDDPEIKQLEGKALIVVGNQVSLLKDKTFVARSDGTPFRFELTSKEKNKLLQSKCHLRTGRLERKPENLKFLDKLIDKATSLSGSSLKIKKYVESPLKKGLRWLLSAVDMSLNIGGGYFLATSLLAGTAGAAALLGTPVGWGLIGLIIIGQFALRLAVGSNAMFNLLNPAAEKHKKVTEEINEYELNTSQYKEILHEKKRVEKVEAEWAKSQAGRLERREQAKHNPYVDSYKESYLMLGFYKCNQDRALKEEKERQPRPQFCAS
jgi:hypothetical protein